MRRNSSVPRSNRLARAYEIDPEKRRDLIQEIHFQLWRSFQRFDARCSLRTWVHRVAHHVAALHVVRERRVFKNLVSLEDLEALPDKKQGPVRPAPESGRLSTSTAFNPNRTR